MTQSVAIVTGASQGIGRSTSIRLARDFSAIVLAARNGAHNLSVKEATERFPEQVGISRYGRPEEIADLLSFMVSPFAKWMTGTSVRMDGGEIKGI
jgi:NAD(P)-dependent dehydrogenase (short-subunit alcohol dehydrogenase family)